MYEFHYKYIKRKYNVKLLFTNTDSLVSVYVDFYTDKDLLDFCDYPQDSKFLYLVNKKVIGKTKDEFKGKIIREFLRLKSKMSSLIAADGEAIKMLLKTQMFVKFLYFAFDDKRYILDNGINSLAYFHKNIKIQ